MTIDFPNGADDMLNFVITMRPDEGLYSGGTFQVRQGAGGVWGLDGWSVGIGW